MLARSWILLVINALLTAGPLTAQTITSDDFSQSTLSSFWSFVNPQNDGQFTLTGASIILRAPAGVIHDPWAPNTAVRLMQPAANGNFGIEAKFQSSPTRRYQGQGLLVEQAPGIYLRFDMYSDGSILRAYAAFINNGAASVKLNRAITAQAAYFLRLERAQDAWTCKLSNDGSTWTTLASFTQALTVASVGFFASNYATAGAPPEFSAEVDYFFNTASPISPEDGAGYSLSVTAGTGGSVTVNPQKNVYNPGESVTLTAVPAGGYVFGNWEGALTGSANPAILVMNANAAVTARFSAQSGGISADDFNGAALSNFWSLVNPLGDAQVGFTGTAVRLQVPAGASHDCWIPNQSVRLMQPAPNSDFGIEVKFTSAINLKYQSQGLIAEQDSNNFVRFDVFADGRRVMAYVAVFIQGVPSVKASPTISGAAPYYLRLARAGASWTCSYSLNGTAWQTAATFTQSLNLQKVGLFGSNYDSGNNAPALTLEADYFSNISAPGDTTPPVISNLAAVPQQTSATVTWQTDESADSLLDAGLNPASYLIHLSDAALVKSHSFNVTGLNPGTTYHFQVSSADAAGNRQTSADQVFTTVTAASAIVSDDFYNGPLNTQRWTLIDPVSDAQVSTTGYSLRIAVPAGRNHDCWAPNESARVMQAAGNTDFGLEAKYDSEPTAAYQSQGLLAQQDNTNFIRMDVYSLSSTRVNLFIASFSNGVPTVRLDTTTSKGAPYYLRLTRAGNQWSCYYSKNGSVWTLGASFSQALAVSSVGAFAGNYAGNGNAPAFTAELDYFFNTAAPINPEDGNQLSLNVNIVGSGTVQKNPDKTLYLAGESVQLTAVPAQDWHFTGWSGSATGSQNPVTVTLAAGMQITARFDPDTPIQNVINVWYGLTQTFGDPGIPQTWVNVLGAITDYTIIDHLNFTVNGGPEQRLMMGFQNPYRLARAGDFNAEIAFDDLNAGNNTVNIIAHLSNGDTVMQSVTVVCRKNLSWPLPYSINWSQISKIQDAAQIVDGYWILTSEGVRSIYAHYDRLIDIGQITWQNYEVTAPFKVYQTFHHANTPALGFVLRWSGHVDWSSQGYNYEPRIGWWPFGAMGHFRWFSTPTSGEWRILGYNGGIVASSTSFERPAFSTWYVMKMRVETVAGMGGLYKFKVWRQGNPEPSAWLMTAQEALWAPQSGSLLLVSHYCDAVFGNVTITPVP